MGDAPVMSVFLEVSVLQTNCRNKYFRTAKTLYSEFKASSILVNILDRRLIIAVASNEFNVSECCTLLSLILYELRVVGFDVYQLLH